METISPEVSVGTKMRYPGEVRSITMSLGLYLDTTLFVSGVLINSLLEEDDEYCFVNELVKGNLLNGLDELILQNNLPDNVAHEIRIWGFKKIITGAFRALSYVKGPFRETLFKDLIGCTYDYAAGHFPVEVRDEDFFVDLFGDI